MDMGWQGPLFELPEGWGAADAVAFYRAESALADAVLDQAPSFDSPSRGDFRPTTLRWAVFHLLEGAGRATSGTWTSPASCSTGAWVAEGRPRGGFESAMRPARPPHVRFLYLEQAVP